MTNALINSICRSLDDEIAMWKRKLASHKKNNPIIIPLSSHTGYKSGDMIIISPSTEGKSLCRLSHS